jgi:hypothetical protein
MPEGEDRREYWARTSVLVLYGGVCVGGSTQAVRTLISRDPWSWTEMFVSGAVWTVGLIALTGLTRTAWFPSRGDREGRSLLRTALATGELPPDARPHAWVPLLEEEIRDLALLRWVIGALGLTVVGLVLAAAGVHNDQGVSALAIAVGGFLGLPLRLLSLRKERAEALMAQVDGC